MTNTVGTPSVTTKEVFESFHGHVVTQYRAEECQFTAAEHAAAEARGAVDGAVILQEFNCPIARLVPFGHKSFVFSNFCQCRHALFEWRAGRWHLHAVGINLLQRGRGDKALKTFFAEGALDGLEYPDGECRVTIRELVVALRCEVPDPRRAANFSPFIDVADQSLLLKGSEMLTYSHRRNLQPIRHPGRAEDTAFAR